LKALISAHREELLRFLDDPSANVLDLRVDPDMERMGAKLLGSLDREPGRDVLVYGVAGRFDDPAAFHARAAAVVREDLARSAADLRGGGIDVGAIEGFEAGRGLSPEVRLAGYLERVRRALARHVKRLILVLRVEEADAALLQASILALSAATASPAIKYVVLDRRAAPLLAPARARIDRLAASVIAADPRPLLRAFVESPTSRVLALFPPARRPDRAPPLVAEVRAALGDVIATAPIEARRAEAAAASASPWSLFDAAEEAIAAVHAGLHPGAPRIGVDPRATSRVEDRFAIFAEGAARAIVPEGLLIVHLDVRSSADPALVRGTLERLAHAASSSRVRYVATLPGGDDAAPWDPTRESGIVSRELQIRPEDTERDLQRELADPALPPPDRLRALCLLSGFALARRDVEKARAIALQAIEQGRAAKLPGDEAFAWMSLGGAFFHERAYAPARDAYAQAAALGFQAKSPLLAAQALLQVGHTHFARAQHDEAAACYRTVAEHFARVGYVPGEAQALTLLGESLRRREAWAEADAAWKAALERLDRGGEVLAEIARPGRIDVLERQARMYDEVGKSDEARALRRRARELGSDGKIQDPA
jgi:tetratricopeptide (TPR) repeat protein